MFEPSRTRCSNPGFGNSRTRCSNPGFRNSRTRCSNPGFGNSRTRCSNPGFGNSRTRCSNPVFGNSRTRCWNPGFGNSRTRCLNPGFGNSRTRCSNPGLNLGFRCLNPGFHPRFGCYVLRPTPSPPKCSNLRFGNTANTYAQNQSWPEHGKCWEETKTNTAGKESQVLWMASKSCGRCRPALFRTLCEIGAQDFDQLTLAIHMQLS